VKQRKWNGLLTVLSVVGGIIGFVIGEIILDRWQGTMHETLLVGIYFGQFALIVGLCCLIAELISPRLNGTNWRLRYAQDGWKFLVPATLLMLFAAGVLCQLIYGLQLGNNSKPQDYVLLIDMSDSMKTNDPQKQSIQAAQSLIRRMDDGKRVAVFTFNDNSQLVYPLTRLKDGAAREEIAAKLNAIGAPAGTTDIGKALTAAMDQLAKERIAGRKAAVILISDGYSDMDAAQVLAPYKQEQTRVHTIGIDPSQKEGAQLLQRIAAETEGTFHDVKGAETLAGVFDQIYQSGQRRHLLNERAGTAAADGYHGILRVTLILLIGTLLGLSLGVVYDNRYLARSFSIGGTAAGLIAGILLETGLQGSGTQPFIVRAAADVLLAFVLSLSTVMIPSGESGGPGSGAGMRRGASGRAERGASRFGGSRDGEPVRKQFR
jgi:Ca-activated chloride channel family protein